MSLSIHPLRPADFEPLKIAAAEDNHGVMWPTHVLRRNGELAGYIGVKSVPGVHIWTNSKAVTARESVQTLLALEDVLRCSGWTEYVAYCQADSPYYPYMRKLGFAPFAKAELFHKPL